MEPVHSIQGEIETIVESIVSSSNSVANRDKKPKKVVFWGELIRPLTCEDLESWSGGKIVVTYQAGDFISSANREKFTERPIIYPSLIINLGLTNCYEYIIEKIPSLAIDPATSFKVTAAKVNSILELMK